MEVFEMLRLLCEAPSVSGDETGALAAVNTCAAAAGLRFTRDALGNYISDGASDVALMAHIDKIGYIVTGIDDATGFLRITNVGGVDARVAPAQRVTVYGERPLPGVIISTPPHLLPKDADREVLPVKKLAIDCGLPFEEIRALVRPGDRALFRAPLRRLSGTRIAGPYLDNSAGAAVALEAARRIGEAGGKVPRVILTAQEEVGCRGAITAAFPESMKTVIALDTTFAAYPGVPEEAAAELGSGARIGFSPILDIALSKDLLRTAREHGIPCTAEVMGRSTGTDADTAGTAGGGKVTGLVSVPIRNMHTPAETADLRDIEAAVKLIAALFAAQE